MERTKRMLFVTLCAVLGFLMSDVMFPGVSRAEQQCPNSYCNALWCSYGTGTNCVQYVIPQPHCQTLECF